MARHTVLVVVVAGAVACSGSSKDSSPPPSTCGTHAPVVTASANPTSVEPTLSVQLTATSTDADDACLAAPEPRTYRWRIESRPPTSGAVLSDPGSPAPTLAPDVPGEYQLEVVATDQAGHASAPAFVTVSASACSLLAPTVSISGPLAGTVSNTVTLPAPVVSDANCLASGAVTYHWTLLARPTGSNAVLSNPAAQRPVFVPDVVGPYQVGLVVTSSLGIESPPAFAVVDVARCGSAAPVLPSLAFSPASPNAGDLVSLGLAGPIVDPNATSCAAGVLPYRYRWTLVSRPPGSSAVLTSESSAAPSFVADVPNGVYQLALAVTDALGNESAPVFAQVGTTSCGALPPSFGGPITFSSAPRAGVPFTALAPAVADGSAACPARFQASGYTYAFAVVGQPAGAAVQLGAGTGASASITASQGGSYSVQVVATSSTGLSTAPLISPVAVSNCGAYPPVASAFGVSQLVPASSGGTIGLADGPAVAGATLTAGGTATSARGYYLDLPVQVSASVTDADAGAACSAFALPAQATTFAWALVSAPVGSRAALAGSGAPTVAFTPDVPGSYTLALTTTDSSGSASTSVVTLSAPCGGSSPAITEMSGTQTVPSTPSTLVTTRTAAAQLAVGYPISLGATTTDVDAVAGGACLASEAQPLTYRWSLAHLPLGSGASLLGASTATPSLVPDVAGSYGVVVTVTDPQGHAATSLLDVSVTCDSAAPAVSPVSGAPGVPDFTVTQLLGGIVVSGQPGTHTVRLTRGSALSNDRAFLDGSPIGLATQVPFYPGVPLQLAASVPSTQSSAGCGLYEQVVTYQWSLLVQPPGSTAQLFGASGPSPSFTPDRPGVYEFQLVLTDQLGRSSRTTLALDTAGADVATVGSCGRRPPIVAARVLGPVPSPPSGTPMEPVGSLTQLDASASLPADAAPFAADGTGGCGLDAPLTYAWSLVSVPPGSTAALTATTLADPSILLDQPGLYSINLSVSDGTNVATASVPVIGSLPSHTSTPAATGQVFTATTTDGSGNPVVAWWDNSNGSVGAARCTAGCATSTPTWTSLGSVDSGLGTMTFAPEDEPRPVAVAVSGTMTYVAYFTSTGPGGTTGVHGLDACTVALATHDGTSWAWTTVPTSVAGPFTACTAGGAPPYTYYEFGRWLSMAMSGTSPVVAYWSVVAADATQLEYSACTTSTCASFAQGTIDAAGARLGRWNSFVVESSGAIDAVYYVDDDGAGARGLRFATNAAGSFAAIDADFSTTADVGRFASIAAVPATPPSGPPTGGPLAIAYADSSARVGKVAMCTRQTPTTWAVETPVVIPDPVTTDAGRDSVIASDPATGHLEIAYFDAGNGVVRIFRSNDGQAFSALADFSAPTATNAPVGLSIAVGTSTGIAYSRSGTGPIGVSTLGP